MGKWALRKIRSGRVKFHGQWYRVTPRQGEPSYDGRLDGKRAWFYQYDYEPRLSQSIFLHSVPDPDAEDEFGWPGPNCIDGVFVWEKWTSGVAEDAPARRPAPGAAYPAGRNAGTEETTWTRNR